MLLIRADGNGAIGAGHVMRCCSIVREVATRGERALFVVSDDEGANLVSGLGFPCELVRGDFRHYGSPDAEKLADVAERNGARSVLVDSYAVSGSFFSQLQARGIRCAYIDDAYTFDDGFSAEPRRWSVDCAVNYSFGFEEADYRRAYGDSGASLAVGPRYAPVRECFRDLGYEVAPSVREVLLTSGATNPGGCLERMVRACALAVPTARVTVVVGPMADFDESCAEGLECEAVRGIRDMSGLMARSDVAIAAAGSTLYELCCVGVPTVAAPVVDNQLANARGAARDGACLALRELGWDERALAGELHGLARSRELRTGLSRRASSLVDGRGAGRIAELVLQIGARR